MNEHTIKLIVKEQYGQAARDAKAGRSSCCGPAKPRSQWDPITSDLYAAAETTGLPPAALAASLGCGNPVALATLNPGETVLDLGSGGGIDVLLSAKRVGPTGKVYGMDMTDEMLALARENQQKAGVTNAEFLKGEIEQIPLPDNSVDVIISNCVINLSADKDRVFSESFRVLKPGGRLAVSDVVVRGPVPPDIRQNVELWIGCVAGALEESEYKVKLERAGFTDVSVEPTRIYRSDDAREFLQGAGLDTDSVAASVDGKFMSAFVRARKPLNTLHIEWKHYEKNGVTCTRCGDTGQTLNQAIQNLHEELARRNITLTFSETILSEQDIPESNSIFFNGAPLEALIPGAKTSENHCRSCSELTGRHTQCRTVEVGDALYEAVPETLIRQAAFRALDLEAPASVLAEPTRACCASCD
jgi:SAM-dependent methyltransferase